MRIDFGSPGARLAASLAPLLFLAATAAAADLDLVPQLVADEDLARIATRPDGSVAVLRADAVDLVQLGGGLSPVAQRSDGEVLFLADGGGFVGVGRFREGAADFAPASSFVLRDIAGRALWTMGQSENVTFAISKEGTVVGMSLNINVPERNVLRFYGGGGELAAEVPVPFLTGGSFDPEGRVFLAMSSADGLRAFDAAGAEIWNVQGARMFAAAPGGREVAVLGDRVLQVVRDGAVAVSISLGDILIRRLAISPDATRIALAGRSEIRVYDTRSLEQQWSRRLEDDALAWTSVDLGGAGGWVLAGLARDLGPGVAQDKRHSTGEVRAYDASGTLVHRAALSFPIWNIWTPTVLLDRSGKAATVTTRRAIYHTVLP